MAPRVSFSGHSLTLVTGTQEGRRKHWKPLRPQLRNGTLSFPLIIPLAKSNSMAIPKYPWDVGKVLYPFWGTAAHSLEREKEWKIENSYLVYHTVGPHGLCLGHMAPIHTVGVPWEGIRGSTRSSEESWLGEALSVEHMEMFTSSSCSIRNVMAHIRGWGGVSG